MLYKLCISLSIGIILGFLLGGIKTKFTNKTYTNRQIKFTKKILNKVVNILKYVTILVLSIGFIWCFYFLILGIVIPAQSDYANNMSELVVSVLTVISIIFAFAEFLRRNDK